MDVNIEQVDWFSARGMKRLHHGVHWVTSRNALRCEIFQKKDNALMARFWHGSEDAENRCFKVQGLRPEQIDDIDWDDDGQWPPAFKKRWDEWLGAEAGYL